MQNSGNIEKIVVECTGIILVMCKHFKTGHEARKCKLRSQTK